MASNLPLALLLEDDEVWVDKIRRSLEVYSEVTVVTTVNETRNALSRRFDCYIFDYDIHGHKKGIELLVQYMQNGTIKGKPILISIFQPQQNVKEKFGFEDFIDKGDPSFMDKLMTRVQHVLETDVNSDMDMLSRLLESVNCLNEPWTDYISDLDFIPLEARALLFADAKTVGDMLALAKNPELPSAIRAQFGEWLRSVYEKKRERLQNSSEVPL